MQLDPAEHFNEIILPAIEAYRSAEHALTEAASANVNRRRADYAALREGGAATLYLHHFADIVAKRGGKGLDDLKGTVAHVRGLLEDVSLRVCGESNVQLLADVADALKHAVLTQRLPREVQDVGQVLVISRGFGEARFGEGKFGGVPEVWILAHSGPRSLGTILDSVAESWNHILAGNR